MNITFERLSYLTTRELWEFMRDLRIPYCNIEEIEKEDLSSHEMRKIPKFIPRTDFENMKSDIIVTLNLLNREQRRRIVKRYEKMIEKREKLSKVKEDG